ncbi:MAG: UDP-N-acetylenolpyruvoylglucosamine reductase, partial [Xanthomonadales bacterium]|nr:UDP-N-acetylenolpyruvoylglucosamine reductase [Xanthomonadales bacterium]
SLRRSKLPDPARIGNAGSFFKNPVVSLALAEQIRQALPALPQFPAGDGQVKLSAAYLIDQAGWKGRRQGDAGVHANHALVLVNHGGASGQDLYRLAGDIAADVQARWQVTLEIEPRVIGTDGAVR